MKIVIVGTGYVGLVGGAGFAVMGIKTVCVDIDKVKIEKLKQGVIPIYEPGLQDLVEKTIKSGDLSFNTSLAESIKDASFVFIAVGTPMGEDGSADLKYVSAVAKDIGKTMQGELIVVNKSTVPVGTADRVKSIIDEQLKKRNETFDFDVVSNPEFLKEGNAVNDFMSPDRIVIGADKPDSLKKMTELYAPFIRKNDRFIAMSVRSAEMTKYAANAMLATKISFMNEISNICESVGADVNDVRLGIGSDNRIGYSFIYPGCGYGGSCFPKDVKALKRTANENGLKAKIITAIEEVNELQKFVLSNKVKKKFGDNLKDKTFAIWGLSFKPGTDDMREAPSIVIIKELINAGAKIKAYDPKAIKEAKKNYLKDIKKIEYIDNKYEVLNDCYAMLLVTEWKEFRSPDFYEMKKRMKNPIIFDGRNQYNRNKLEQIGFEYIQIGVGN